MCVCIFKVLKLVLFAFIPTAVVLIAFLELGPYSGKYNYFRVADKYMCLSTLKNLTEIIRYSPVFRCRYGSLVKGRLSYLSSSLANNLIAD